jgi:hypothetical protein
MAMNRTYSAKSSGSTAASAVSGAAAVAAAHSHGDSHVAKYCESKTFTLEKGQGEY